MICESIKRMAFEKAGQVQEAGVAGDWGREGKTVRVAVELWT